MAYTDTGSGHPVVLLHGNPTSARLWRHVIAALAPDYRCIAPDLLGFGRSAAPTGADYRPQAHATRLDVLLRTLDLSPCTLVLHDWGGPVGWDYAVRHPSAVQRLVLTNTWAWPLTHRPLVRLFSGAASTLLGRLLIERAAAFPRVVMPLVSGSPRANWIAAHARALDSRSRRHACWVLARSLLAESDWLRALWTHRHRLRGRPALLCWGQADPSFGGPSTLQRWTSLFSDATIYTDRSTGHYVPEEWGPRLGSRIRRFVDSA